MKNRERDFFLILVGGLAGGQHSSFFSYLYLFLGDPTAEMKAPPPLGHEDEDYLCTMCRYM